MWVNQLKIAYWFHSISISNRHDFYLKPYTVRHWLNVSCHVCSSHDVKEHSTILLALESLKLKILFAPCLGASVYILWEGRPHQPQRHKKQGQVPLYQEEGCFQAGSVSPWHRALPYADVCSILTFSIQKWWWASIIARRITEKVPL